MKDIKTTTGLSRVIGLLKKPFKHMRTMSLGKLCLLFFILQFTFFISSCYRQPDLHLYDSIEGDIEIPLVDLELEAYWDYELEYGIAYDWRAEWVYGML